MKTKNKLKVMCSTLIIGLILFSSCRKPEEEYDYEENNQPQGKIVLNSPRVDINTFSTIKQS